MHNSYVRPILENCIQLLCLHLVQNIDMLEKVQKQATKIIPGIRFIPSPGLPVTQHAKKS